VPRLLGHDDYDQGDYDNYQGHYYNDYNYSADYDYYFV